MRNSEYCRYQCNTRDGAWAFMRALHEAGLMAGYPSLKRERGYYTVQVRWEDTEKADEVYGSGPEW